MDDSVVEVDVDRDSPVVSRTRSGLRLRAPAATPNAKASITPVRRTRKSVVREEPPENAECQLKTNDKSDECSPAPEATPVVETDATAAPPADVSPQPDSNPPSISDQSSEKENVLNNTQSCSTVPVDSKKTNKKRSHSESNVKTNKMVPFGKPKSGRVWKERKKQRFSALLRDKPLRTSWEKKMEAKREKQLVKQFHQQLKDEKARAIEEKKKRRVENLKRRAENERKAEIVQVIKNTSKIKRMKKKQLRKIEKRDTLAALQKTPPAVKKASGKAKAKAGL